MPFIFTSKGQQTLWATQSNMIPSAITGLNANSTVAGQITLSWSGGLGNNVKYSYALSTGTIQSVSGTASPVTITLTSTNSVTTTVTVTATVLAGSASAVSNSVTTLFVQQTPTATSPNSYIPFIAYSFSTNRVSGSTVTNAMNSMNNLGFYGGASCRTFGSYNVLDVSNNNTSPGVAQFPSYTGNKAIINGTGSGNNAYLDTTYNTTTTYTITFWTYLLSRNVNGSNNYNITVATNSVLGNATYRCGETGGYHIFLQQGGSVSQTSIAYSLNTWYFCSFSFTTNSGSPTFTTTPVGNTYGGVNTTTSTVSYTTISTPISLGFGTDLNGSPSFYNSYYADYRVYNTVLSSSDIGSIYNGGIQQY